MTSVSARRLERIPEHGKIAGVCAGMAAYFETDVTLVRTLWVVLSLVPGALIGGALAYAAAWMLMPVSLISVAAVPPKRLVRPQADRTIGGVCAAIARYFSVDVTAVRLLWVVLSIYPGAIILGVLAYSIAWFIIPSEPLPVERAAPSA